MRPGMNIAFQSCFLSGLTADRKLLDATGRRGTYSFGDCSMARDRFCAFSTLFMAIVIAGALALQADAQSVISTRAGLIHFFEGTVYLGDQKLESRLGRFPSMQPGAE